MTYTIPLRNCKTPLPVTISTYDRHCPAGRDFLSKPSSRNTKSCTSLIARSHTNPNEHENNSSSLIQRNYLLTLRTNIFMQPSQSSHVSSALFQNQHENNSTKHRTKHQHIPSPLQCPLIHPHSTNATPDQRKIHSPVQSSTRRIPNSETVHVPCSTP